MGQKPHFGGVSAFLDRPLSSPAPGSPQRPSSRMPYARRPDRTMAHRSPGALVAMAVGGDVPRRRSAPRSKESSMSRLDILFVASMVSGVGLVGTLFFALIAP